MWTDEQTKFLISNYPNYGTKYCSDALGYSTNQIVNKVNNLSGKGVNLIMTKKGRSFAADKTPRPKPANHCNINPNIFIYPNTKEAIYILGLLWADGYVYKNKNPEKKKKYRISLELQFDDFVAIENILDATGKWNKWLRKSSKLHKTQGLAVTFNKAIHDFLSSYDYGLKHHSPSILSIIPNNMKHYWFRGYFDGDGCFYYKNCTKQMSINSCYEQDWAFMENLCNTLSISKYSIQRLIRKNTNACSTFRITNRDGIKKFGHYIYQNYDKLGFGRKYEKFKHIDEMPVLKPGPKSTKEKA
jgi:hypothetical protein